MKAIGVFDSGLGGLTVVRELQARFPNQSIVYLGDTARVPYGSKSARTVERYSLRCLDFLLEKQVELVLIACNTASAHALPALQAQSPVPVIGAVQPGAETALATTKNNAIAVLATLGTVNSGAYQEAIERLRPEAIVITKACPLLVPLAEEGWTDGPIAEAIVSRYLSELFEESADIDTLVLGCTHYPLLAPLIGQVATRLRSASIAVVDSASAMVDKARPHLPGPADQKGRLRAYLTDASRMEELAPRFLGHALTSIELVDL